MSSRWVRSWVVVAALLPLAGRAQPTESPDAGEGELLVEADAGVPLPDAPTAEAPPTEAPAESVDAGVVLEPVVEAVPETVPEAVPETVAKGFSTVVVGTAETKTSGSIHIIKSAKLERSELDDPQAVLQSVPGVYGRGEDGFGLRPNVGLRGANSDRSKKVTLLEDGVLFGPAPYSAPAAYYFPLMTRMKSVRVLKGPSAIIHGPQTIGGSVELITRSITQGESYGIDLSGGEYFYGKAHGFYGAGNERSGFLVEGIHLRSSGFKELDGGGDTGFRRNEWMVKARHALDLEGPSRQSLQLKVGYSDELSNETYLGLSDADFRANPLRRYLASTLDQMTWKRTQIVASHELKHGSFALTTTAYRHDLNRSWNKVNRFRGASVANVLADPDSARNAIYYGVLTGALDAQTADETLLIGPNQRVFVSQGVQSVARWSMATGPVHHDVEVGARYHYDSIDRLHTERGFVMTQGVLVHDGRQTTTTADNFDSTHAVALHALDALVWKRLTLTPGVRVEIIRSRSVDRLLSESNEGGVTFAMPGLGAHVSLAEPLGVFAGVYRGFSPPAPGQAGTVLPEESINYEAGARWTRGGSERIELIGFFNDYMNLTDICTFSNGCLAANLDRQIDAGQANIWGLEAYVEKTFRLGRYAFPLSAAYTLTRTRLLESFLSADPQFGAVRAGDELPYVPRHQAVGTLAIEAPRWGAYVSGTYLGVMRETAGQGPALPGEHTDAQLTFDLGASFHPTPRSKLYLNVRNVLDEHVIVSRRPYGARPNAPRTLLAGFKYGF